MKIEISTTSVSKKGTVWMQVKVLEGETPATGTVFECKEVKVKEEKPKKEKKK